MSKLTKMLLCIGMVVVLMATLSVFASATTTADTSEPVCYEHGDVNGDGKVDNKDAIYIMYSYMFDEELFPIEQVWDYNGDSRKDNKDAIYIMYHYMFDDIDDFKLDGTIHSYYDPTWVWNDASNTAEVTFKCGCGTPSKYTVQNGVTVTAGDTSPATCVSAGFETYVATINVDGNEYTNTYVKTVPAGNGHSMSGERDCENGSQCSLCDYSLPALGHNWALEETVDATCTGNAVEVYRCGTCQETNRVEQEGTAGHTLQYLEDRNSGCKYVKWYKCANCDHEVDGTAASDTYYNHTYTATLTKEATCVSTGVKTYVCQCGDSYTESIPTNDSHNWSEESTVNGVTTHACANSGCSATKTTVAVTESTELSTDALSNELQLRGGAAMSLDEDTVAGLDQNKTVVVSVVPLEEDDALMDVLTDEQKSQIGNNTVYDFNMAYSNGDKISNFDGNVTISLPYTLEDGEDIDSIDVWYIDDDGNATQVTGTYSNSYVTFTTDHFSYYSVVRLTPEERCNRYGHILVEASKEATCTQDGFNMSVCQRCGHVEKDEVLTRKGHDYKQTTVAATCTQAGSFEKVCTRSDCGHKVTGVIPALRHDMQKDDTQTVEASCTAAGKTVYVCSHEGCEYTIESAIAQLSHNYEVATVKAADCSNKGYTEKKCSLCGDIIYTDETLPLGHTYEVSEWNWTSDHLSAELTLVCANDASHVKTLSAVVTQKKENASCMGSGTVTNTATASFNQITYTDTYTQTTAAIGHKPGADWQYDGNNHYHICSVCSEPVNSANHTWNDGIVTKEPTCNAVGSATYQCVVCQYEKEKTIPATKEHNYVNGVCSTCGKVETDCIHERVTETELDLTGWNICEGAEITKYSCDCGQNVYFTWDVSCDATSESEEIIDYNGQQVIQRTNKCDDCGLSISYVHFAYMQDDACIGTYAVHYTISATGQEPLVGTNIYYGEESVHPGVTMQTLSLKEYGLCGEVLSIQTCGCEEQVVTTETLESCRWNYIGQDGSYVCMDCGAKRVTAWDYEESDDTCFETELYTVTYYVDDVQVYSFTNRRTYAYHNYTITDYELLGDTCEDGVIYESTCIDCGITLTHYSEYHVGVIEEVVDLSDANICYESVILSYCACEKQYQYYEFNDYSCSWNYLGFDEETGLEIYVCMDCGAKRTIEQEKSEKDENCTVVFNNTYVYTAEDGTHIITTKQTYSEPYHDYAVEYTLKGETCEDGVIIKSTCVDCGAKNNYTSYYHESYKQQSYNLAEYGMCGGTAEVWGCPCGEEAHVNFNSRCIWQHVALDGGKNFEIAIYYCDNCKNYYDRKVERKETDDPCIKEEVYTYTLYKGGPENKQILLTFSFSRMTQIHEIITTYTLNDETVGCLGGYTVIQTCKYCNYRDSWSDSGSDSHPTYSVAEETHSSEHMCGNIVKHVRTCPCGAIREESFSTNCVWNWYGGGYNYNVQQCSNCGTKRTSTYTYHDIEGETCKQLYVEDIVFTYNDTELFSIQLTRNSYNHKYVYTFEMDGTTCEEGYTANGTCVNCGETTQDREYECRGFAVSREVVLNNADACGTIYWVNYKCACGKNSSWEFDDDCNWQWYSSDRDGAEIYVCHTCGAKRTEKSDSERIAGTCQYQITKTGSFTIGENSYTYEKTYVELQHTTVYNLTLLGDDCTDGVQVTAGCVYCDYVSDRGTIYDHEKFATQYYDLTEYGMCGGHVCNNSCGCGLNSSWNWDLSYCTISSTGTIDPDTNDTEYYCINCQNYFSWGRDGALNTDTCTYEGEFYFKLRNSEQTLLNLRGATSQEEHDTYIYSYELLNPNGDCEDGVKRYWQCKNCDHGWYGTSYGHDLMELDYVEIGCGGKVSYTSCACGKHKDVETSYSCNSLTYDRYTETDENGIVHEFINRSCKECGLNIVSEVYNIPVGNCLYNQTCIYTITGGNVDKVFEYTTETTIHSNLTYTYVLAPGSDNCENGTIRIENCSDCGYSNSWHTSGHSICVQENVNLSDYGACSGEVQIRSCPCGERQEIDFNNLCAQTYDSWETVGENGVTYEFTLRTCSKCGLKVETILHKEATDTLCQYTYYRNTTVSIGDNQWSAQNIYTRTEHKTERTYTLLEGSLNCEDGVLAEEKCTVCDYYNSWTNNYHSENLVESVDLSKYSNVCGGTLDFYQCPCGYSGYYNFNGDTCCDFDEESINIWIEDVVDEHNYSIDDNWKNSYAYILRCSVTDPDVCGLVMRRADYYLKTDGCYVTRYVTFQIGYDEETGTYQKEITYAVGRKQFHNYTITNLDAKAADGSYTSGEHYVCADCQSEYYTIEEYNANGNIIREETYYRNTLNDGNYKYRGDIYTYQVINGTSYNDTSYHIYIYADGSEYWYQDDYNYDVENCTRTETYTNSDGEKTINEYEWHQKTTYHYERVDATCSQPGYYHWWYTCDVCGEITEDNKNVYTPGHNWYKDSNSDTYYCCECGLYCDSGADGDVVMEDLTEEYGNGTEYVVGYYNPKEHMFVVNVSVILEDVEGEDNQIDLGITDITYYTYDADGFTGLSVNKELADTAAAEAVAELGGYEGAYAIRISFVPISSNFTLDYAITFDAVTAK